MWGDPKAQRVQSLVEDAHGGVCPCKRGAPCPLLPRDVELPQPREGVQIVLGPSLEGGAVNGVPFQSAGRCAQ